MSLDIQTLAYILSVILVTQVIALFVQYRISSKTYQGIGLWLFGAILMAFGFVFMPMVNVESLKILAIIANPLVMLGQVFFYIGVVRFLNKKENSLSLILFFVTSVLAYYYFMFVNNDISSRSIIVNATLAIISFLTAYRLFVDKERRLKSISVNFIATIFLINGAFLAFRLIWILSLPPLLNYQDQAAVLNSGFIASIILSTLWTFGFILMVNHRLNTDNILEKEKMQLVFNTGPDAAIITRLSDGFIVDVNVKFTLLSEYLREDLLGSSIREIKFWENKNEQMFFLNDLISFGQSENTEFVFRRKGGSQFFGVISSNIILIQTIPHVVSVIHDITERKEAEQHIQDLLKQLEIEKNTAQVNAITDSLTGLGNRRYFDVALEREFYRLKRSGATLSLIIIDVDHFKKFNDKYGHLAGDDCLIQIGNILKAIAGRAPDIVTRYGGEEFVVILPETESDGAKVLAERIRKDVEELGVPHATSETAEVVTVSLGVVSVKTNNLFSQNQVLALADEALYVAKEKGRNRIIIANGKNTFESKEQIDLFTLSD